MARIRTIKPEFFDDEDVAALPVLVRLGFIGLWCQADKAGRLEDRPARLKARIFPFDDVDMEGLLSALERGRFIVRYAVGGRRYIAVRSWEKHQRPRTDEDPSRLPPPNGETAEPPRSDDDDTAESRGKERKGREGEGNGGSCAEAACGSAPNVRSGDAVAEETADERPDGEAILRLDFPVTGAPGGVWTLPAGLVATLADAFPGVDILAEARKALAWIETNRGNRKTANGMPRFLNGWIARSVDSGRAVRLPATADAGPGASSPWHEVMGTLVPRHAFFEWIRPCRLERRNGGVFVLTATAEFANYVRRHYGDQAQAASERVYRRRCVIVGREEFAAAVARGVRDEVVAS